MGFFKYLILLFFSVYAGTSAADRLQLVDGQFDGRGGATRAAIAADLLAEIRLVTRGIAPSTVQERNATVREFGAIQVLDDTAQVNTRMQHLTRTAGYQAGQLVQTLVAVEESLSCVAEDRSAGIKREMACWAIASHYLADRALIDEAVPVLRKAGRLAIDGGMTSSRWNTLGMALARYGRGIQEYIVIPYLKGELSGAIMQVCGGQGARC